MSEQIRDVKDIQFDVEQLMKAKSFLEIVDGNVETAFYFGFFRDELQRPLQVALMVRGEEGIELVKSFDKAMQDARPYVDQMTEVSNKLMEGEEFTMLDVINGTINGIEYKEENDKFYVAFILGMWTRHLIDEDVVESQDDDEDFVEDPNADA